MAGPVPGDLEHAPDPASPRGHRAARARLRLPAVRLAVLTEADLAGSRGLAPGQTRRMPCRRRNGDRPARSSARRLRRARAARRRQVRGDDAAAPCRARPASTWSSSTRRASAATRRPAVRAHRPARPGDQVRRRRGARPCTGWAAPTGPRPRAGPARRSSDIAAGLIRLYQRADGLAGTRVRARHARGSASWRTPSPTSRRPTSCAAIDEVKARHGEAGPDGPADLRRRRLRQDRDRGAGGVQGGAGRQAGGGPGPDHAAGRSSTWRPSASATRRSR